MPIILACLLLSACGSLPQSPPGTLAKPSDTTTSRLIPLTSSEGEQLLYGSRAKQDFLPLSMHFVSQQNLAYCGAASMTMVLNALNIPAPIDPVYVRFPMFTQNNVFNAKTDRVVNSETIAKQGMTLDQLGGMLATYPVATQVYHAGDSSLEQFRKLAVENLKQPGNFILVNYLRTSLGQQTSGHISPIGAYDQAGDQFLILDVARFKYPPVWVKTEALWRAMNTIDDASGKTRGFVSVSRTATLDPGH
ncbi:phytochelatin synthase family protein [Methylomicrobium lacus]|uniref:phytochelatin synthase family protein n=1 Tax=Methylomicrobium lacus TaxID=136992 RepID=UPI0035A86865